ncbi:MAG: AAA family ATPase [Pseudohongiellaceae bacterium]
MSFLEKIDRAQELLEKSKAISLRALRREFSLDEDSLQDLIEELVDIRKVASVDGKILSWSGTPSGKEQGERRQLTVVFCDLVGSTELAENLDPEEFGLILHDYREACDQVVRFFSGHIAQYLGDGVLIYFGFPAALEDAADRAIRAGLEIQKQLHKRFGGEIQARVAIHTGTVVVDPTAAGDKALALGSATNIAARMQQSGRPGTVLVSKSTLANCRGTFDSVSLGGIELKGLKGTLELFEIKSVAHNPSGAAIAVTQPLLGRDGELSRIIESWSAVRNGKFQAVLVSGEAGIGKSRLVQAFREQLNLKSSKWFDLYCSHFTSGSAFQPLVDLQTSYFGINSGQKSKEARELLVSRVEALPGLQPDNVIPYLLALLQLPASEKYPILQTSSNEQRDRTIKAMLELLHAIGNVTPVVIFLEDFHWSDPSTAEFFEHLVHCKMDTRIMLVITSRSIAPVHWSPSEYTQIHLKRLASEFAREMIKQSAGAEIPESVLLELEGRSDGIPLFISEMISNVVRSGKVVEREGKRFLNINLGELPIPSTLQDSLMAKLDRLGSPKSVAQQAATLGREFSYKLLSIVSGLEESYLNISLQNLVSEGILIQQDSPPDANYTFRHALLQDAAYESLLLTTRQDIHAKVVTALEKAFPKRVASEPEMIARHCEAAQLYSKAVEYYHRSAELAEKRLSNEEANNNYECALRVLEKLDDDDSRRQREVAIRLAQNKVVAALHGFMSPQVQSSIERIEMLCDSFGDEELKLPSLMGLVEFYGVSGSLLRSKTRANELLKIAESVNLPIALAVANLALGGVNSESGFLHISKERYIKCVDSPVAKQMPPPATSNDQEFLSLALIAYASTIAAMAEFEESRVRTQQAIERAKKYGNDMTQASVYALASMNGYLFHDPELAKQYVDKAIDLSEGRGFHAALTMAKMTRGWALAMDKKFTAGITDIEAGLDIARKTGVIPAMPLMHCIAANTYFLNQGYDKANQQVETALAVIKRDGSVGYMSWILNMKARIQLASGNCGESEVEATLLDSYNLAKTHHSKFSELVAAKMIAETVTQRDKYEAAYNRLDAVFRQVAAYPSSVLWSEARIALEKLSTRISSSIQS